MNPYYIFYEEVMMKVRMSLFKAFFTSNVQPQYLVFQDDLDVDVLGHLDTH